MSTTEKYSPLALTLTHRKPITLEAELLTVEVIDIKDSRCPKEARCVWAGHAAVTLKVSKAGLETETIVIGTAAPASMNLPGEAAYSVYRFKLLKLDPANSIALPPKQKDYRAKLEINGR